ncbi:MAG: hypothetical protein JWM80_916 [Cyanobacteria bacterium RYN_339]|nr:hypothetical protein [Cyanobacteria bacterium RYN_339]
MPPINQRLVLQALPLTLACALVTSCALGKSPVQTPANEGAVAASQGTQSLATRAAALGLAAPDSYVTATQFQVKDQNGSPVAGVTVIVGDQKLVTNDLGVIELPAEALADTSRPTIAATVTRDGFVGQSANVIAGAALKIVPVDAARTAVGASGGVARNSKNNVEVQFPPGALVGDGQIAVTRRYSEQLSADTDVPKELYTDHYGEGQDLKVNAKLLPVMGEYKYNLDLGGAQLAPGAKYSVRFKVEGPMLKVLKNRMDAGDDLHTLTDVVSKDANGDLWVTMVGYGPGASADGGPYKLAATTCQTYYDETVADLPANSRAMTACIEFWDASYRDPWLAAGNHIGVAGIMTHDGRFNGGGCIYYDYDPNLYVCRDGGYQGGWWADRRDKIMRRWYTSTINAHVTWSSDDGRIANHAIPGASVYFSHTETPVHPATMSQTADGGGDAHTTGLQNAGGSAIASVPGMDYTYGRRAYYNVDCSTAQLQVIKNKPRVYLTTTVGGTPTASSLDYPTNLGAMNGGTSNPSFTPAIALEAATASFSVNGLVRPDATTQVDVQSNTASIGWNQGTSVPTSVWWSRPIGVNLAYVSNDATVPADMRPTGAGNTWSGAAAPNSNVLFSHAVSGAQAKPAGRDTLSFQAVSSASTFGLNGTAGTVNATHTTGSVQLRGSATYTVAGQTLNLGVNANLPEVVFTITGAGNNWRMDYDLTDASGNKRSLKMSLPAASSDGKIHVWLPIEEAVGSAGQYSFKPTFIGTQDYSLTMPGGGFNFPALAGLARATVTPYTSLTSTFVTPK